MSTAHQEWQRTDQAQTFQEWCRKRDLAEAERLEREALVHKEQATEFSVLADKAARANDEAEAARTQAIAQQHKDKAEDARRRADRLQRCLPCD